jgi:hypothetical protein
VCDPTCSLLSPFQPLGTVPYMKKNWRQHACESIESYHLVVKQMQEKGKHVGPSQTKKWGIDVEITKKDALIWSKIKEENGWTKTADYSKASKVADMDWTFEGAWSTREALDEEMGPDETCVLCTKNYRLDPALLAPGKLV